MARLTLRPRSQKPYLGTLIDSGHPMAERLVGYWPFNDGIGSNVNDSSGRGYSGTWTGTLGAQWGVGAKGAHGVFNGTDNYVSLPLAVASTMITPATPLTMAALVSMSSASSSPVIMGLESSTSSQWELNCSLATRKPVFQSHSVAVTSATAMALNTFHLLVGTWDKTSISLYVDGVLVAGPTASGAAGAAATYGASIGRRPSSNTLFWPGSVVYAAMWARCLSAGEVMRLYAEPYGSFSVPYFLSFPPPVLEFDDTTALADALNGNLGLSLSDTGAFTETDTSALGLTVLDTAALLDALTTSQSSGVTLTDAPALADALTSALSTSLLDSVTLADVRSGNLGSLLTESLSLADVYLTIDASNVNLLDSLAFVDALAAALGLTVSDTTALVDSASYAVSAPSGIGGQETMTLFDAISAYLTSVQIVPKLYALPLAVPQPVY